MHDIQKLVQDDNRVRIVFVELPIRVAVAAKRQGKYWEFHQALLASKGQVNEASSLQVAKTLGLEMEKIKADMKSPETAEELRKMKALAKRMGIYTTPYFLVGDKAIAGAADDLHSWLQRYVFDFRKSGCGYC
jgi:protein-disulfide isomerase